MGRTLGQQPTTFPRRRANVEERASSFVEDNAELRSYLAEAVRLLRYNVMTAQSGEPALDLLVRDDLRLDLMLTDVVMPG